MARKQCSGRRILLQDEVLDELKKPRVIGKEVWSGVTKEWNEGKWNLLKVGSPAEAFNFRNMADLGADANGLTEWTFLKERGRSDEPVSEIAGAWEKFVGQRVVIPYDIDARRRVFRAAFERLAPYIEAWQTAQEKQESPDR